MNGPAVMSIHFPTRDEAKRVRRKAKELGMTPSAFMREAVREKLDEKPRRREKLRVIEGGKS